MDADWAALNAAQQAALILWFPVAGYIALRIAWISGDRRWPLPLAIGLVLLCACGGAAVLTLILGDIRT